MLNGSHPMSVSHQHFHPLPFPAQAGPDGVRAIFPIYVLSHRQDARFLQHRSREGNKRGAHRLRGGVSWLRLYHRVQAQRLCRSCPQANRGQGLCQALRCRQPQSDCPRHQLLIRERNYRRISYEGTRGSGGSGSSILKSEPMYLSHDPLINDY